MFKTNLQLSTTLLTITSFIMLSGCATKHATSYPPFLGVPIAQQQEGVFFKQKTDTVFTLLDTFSSKNPIYDKANVFESKFTIQKQILNRINKTIPQDITLYSGLRSFGLGECVNWGVTELLQDIIPHERYVFQHSIDKADCASGRSITDSPLDVALQDAYTDLDKAKGQIALLIISDGLVSANTFLTANTLKDKFADRLCIYSVWIGNKEDQSGLNTLRELSDISKCGESVAFTEINSNVTLGLFVENMLFAKYPYIAPPDEILDTDNDGIFDDNDLCPDTPKGAHVNKYGCWTIKGLEFDFDKATIRSGSEPSLNKAIQILKDNLELKIQIEGHTDSWGSNLYNLNLSNRRAASVRKYLISKDIDSKRLTSIGLGEYSPITNNETPEGRQINRRVVFTLMK